MRTEDRLSREDMKILREGVEVGPGMFFKCASVEETPQGFQLGLREGRKREIRLLLSALGHRVADLKRIAFGGVELGDLPEGKFRTLTPKELESLQRKP